VDSYGYYWGEYNFTYSDEPGEHFIVSLTPSDFYEGQIAVGYFIYEGDEVINSVGTEYVEKDGDCMELWMYIEDEWLNFAAHSSIYTLASTDSTETLITTYGYDANGNRISMTNANGTSTTYAYNKANLVTSVQNMSGEVVLSSHAYTYYLDGNIKTEVVDGDTKTYTYDDLGRLTREVKSGVLNAGDIVYTYDVRGNRASRTQGTATTTYTYDANNRLLAETTGASGKVYSYDANGNTLTVYKDGTLVASYTYGLFGTRGHKCLNFEAQTKLHKNNRIILKDSSHEPSFFFLGGENVKI
jgi:YD repeat-containing protein